MPTPTFLLAAVPLALAGLAVGLLAGVLLLRRVRGRLRRLETAHALLTHAFHASSSRLQSSESAMEQLQEEVGRLTHLERQKHLQFEVTEALEQSKDLEAAGNQLLPLIASSLQDSWTFGALWLRDIEGKNWHQVSTWRRPGSEAEGLREPGSPSPLVQDLPQLQAYPLEPAWAQGLAHEPILQTAGLGGTMALPILANGVLHGAIMFHAPVLEEPDTALLEALGALGSQMGQFANHCAVEAALAKAKDAAERSSESTRTFMSHISYEARHPLNAILLYTQLLEEDAQRAGLEQLTPDLQKVHSAGEHLLSLINEILPLANTEPEKAEPAPEAPEAVGMQEGTLAPPQPPEAVHHNVHDVEFTPGVDRLRSGPHRRL